MTSDASPATARLIVFVCATACMLSPDARNIACETDKAPQYTLPPAKYEVRLEKSVPVPMRDGVELLTDLYFPIGLEGKKLPVVLERTPYGKRWARPEHGPRLDGSDAVVWAGQGYIVAVQDVRGRHSSGGTPMEVVSEADRQDGCDTLTWLAEQPWCNGKIGTIGCSYGGVTQVQLAAMRHPNHTAAIPHHAGGAYAARDYRPNGFNHTGGVVELGNARWFYSTAWGYPTLNPPDGRSRADWYSSPESQAYSLSPWLPELSKAGHEKRFLTRATKDYYSELEKLGWADHVSHPPGDPWWDRAGYLTWEDTFDVPALHISSWADTKDTYGAIMNFVLMRENAVSERGAWQRLVISPMPHCRTHRGLREMDVNELTVRNAEFDYWGHCLRWFDYWLKGKQNGALEMPPVTYFLIGADRWETAEAFPPKEARTVRLYLDSDGDANTSSGDGVLQWARPAKAQVDTFVYDPSDPVRMPEPGSRTGELIERQWPELGLDHSEVERRQDVLVYTTEPLEKPLTIVGHLKVELHVSSAAKDTDFTATLLDVQPDARPLKLQQGIRRVRYRNGYENPELMQPGRTCKVPVEMQSMAYVFKPGHRIRLEISSSAFPRWERNMNTGGNNYDEAVGIPATNRVHHGPEHPSAILLPVLK